MTGVGVSKPSLRMASQCKRTTEASKFILNSVGYCCSCQIKLILFSKLKKGKTKELLKKYLPKRERF